MAVDDAFQMLAAEYWDSVWSSLDAAQRSELAGAVGQLVSADPDEEAFSRATLRLIDVLRDLLPEEHPVLEAADETYRWAGGPPVNWRPVLTALSARLAAIISEDVHEWLKRSPALSADQVMSGGSDPGQRFLIRLESRRRGLRFPAFQFDPHGRPIGTVLRINERLGADDDPWGVTDWWLGENAWLDAVPAELIGSRDDLLLAAADAVTRPDWW
jgi:hypothetical protein